MLQRALSGSGSGGGGTHLYLYDTVTCSFGSNINIWYDTNISLDGVALISTTNSVFGNAFIGYPDSSNTLQTLSKNACDVRISANNTLEYKSTYSNSNVVVAVYKIE